MNKLDLIGLCAKKRAGKDTAGDYLIKKYGYVKYSFAGALKKACEEIFMLNKEQVYGNKKEEKDFTLNEMQDYLEEGLTSKEHRLVGIELDRIYKDKMEKVITEDNVNDYIDPKNNLPFKGRIRRIRILFYRRYDSKSRSKKTDVINKNCNFIKDK